MRDRKIKLFVDAHSFDAGYQGTQTFIRELYANLMDTYPDLDIYWGVEDPERIKTIFPSVKPEHILIYKKRRLSLLRFVFDIPAMIRKNGFDYAHFQYISPLKQAGCKYIVTTHDVLFNDYPNDFSWAYRVSRNILFGRSIKNSDIKTTVSEYSKQRISHHYNIPETEIKVIANGVVKPDISRNVAKEVIKAKFGLENFILYVSRIEPRKNHALLLQKYLKLELYKQNIPLVFIGKLSIPVKEMGKLMASLTSQQRTMLYWLPEVDQQDLEAFYSACKVFVYPSKAEGFGIPPLEAAVCGAPVLCSSTTAMGDYPFFAPYAFDPQNETEFEQKLAYIIATPPSAAALKNIATQVEQNYQWHQSAQLLHNLMVIGLRDKPGKTIQPTEPINTIHTPILQFKQH